MKHLNEEELVAVFYGEDKPGRRHVEACGECGRAFAEVAADMKAIKPIEAPERDAAYGDRVWARLAPRLVPYEKTQRGWMGLWGRAFPGPKRGTWSTQLFSLKAFSVVAACVALLAVTFTAGRVWELHKHQPRTATVASKDSVVRPQVVVVVLSDHLDRSERLLTELKHADSDESVAPLEDEARVLLAANKTVRKQVKDDDDPALAKALDRLDHLLSELASQPEQPSPVELERLQKEMTAEGVLFEVRVLRSRSKGTHTLSNGGTI
jgi:hypothetical protein